MRDDPSATQDTIVWDSAGTPRGAGDRRRLTGITVIVLAVIAMMVLTAGRQRTVSGAAVVPPPPQVGDCLSTEPDDQIGQEMTESEIPTLVTEPCSGTRAGEVVSAVNHRVFSQGDCWTPAMRYLGLPTPTRTGQDPGSGSASQSGSPSPAESPSESIWIPRLRVFGSTFGPSALQVAAGQLWSACVLLGASREDSRPQPFGESARDAALWGGTAFEPFASCANSSSPEESTPCGSPHRYEVMGDAGELGPSEADTLASCAALVTRLTGLQDPSADGRLQVRMAACRYDQTDEVLRESTCQQARAARGGVTCTVSPTAADEVLTTTLVGLGAQPLPIV